MVLASGERYVSPHTLAPAGTWEQGASYAKSGSRKKHARRSASVQLSFISSLGVQLAVWLHAWHLTVTVPIS